MKKIKVIIIDDSSLIQKMLVSILNNDPDIIVVALADNPIIARQLIKTLNPDVLVLDVEMPEMDGLTFLEKLMRLRPMPVVMCSSFTPHCREVTLEAFRLGVVDIISKPILSSSANDVINKIKNAAQVKIKQIESIATSPTILPTTNPKFSNNYVFAIGASTGGTEALKMLFQSLPDNFPPIVVTQHLPEGFGELFAARANQKSQMTIRIAQDGERLVKGHVYIAPAGKHLELVTKSKELLIKLSHADNAMDHVPSVDVMMKSVAAIMGNHSTGILLTGMGTDGAQGMLEIQKSGGMTIAQDEESSVVWGMPRAAVEIGAAKHVLPLHKIPEMMLKNINTFSS